MAQKVTESVKGMDQGMETVAEVGLERAGAEVGKGLDGSPFKSSVSGGKSGSAEVDETVADSALVGEVGSDDTEDADSLGFDDMDSGELTDMENTGGLVYREKFMATPRDSDDTLACIFFVILHQNRLLSGRRKKALFVSPSPDTASKRAKGIYDTLKNSGTKKREKSFEISRFLAFWLTKRLFSSCGSILTTQHGVSLQNRCTPHFFQNRAGLFCFWIDLSLGETGACK